MSVNNLLMASAQMFPPKAKWSVEQIPDLSGKVVMVTGVYSIYRVLPALNSTSCSSYRTGGNTGIGKETVKVRISVRFPIPNSS